MRKRPIKISVRLTKSEQEYLIRQAQLAGLSRESFIRKLIMGQTIRPKPPQEIAELLRLLKSISNNVNQIARVTNARQFIRSDELAEIRADLDSLWFAIKRI